MYQGILKFLRCAGKAVLPKIPKWAAKVMGLELVADMVDVGQEFYRNWRAESSEAQARVELQAVAQPLPVAQFKQLVLQVVSELAAKQPAQVRQGLTQYLMQIPSATRQALRRPADPTGTTVPPTMSLHKPEDMAGLLPFGLAQFQIGERPACLHGKWELLELLGRGGQGEVWKACKKDDPTFVSAFKFCTDPDAKRKLQLGHEKAIVQRVSQANVKGVVGLVDYELDSSPPWLRYELVEGGDLTGLVHEWNESPAVKRTPLVLSIMQRLSRTVGQFHRLRDAQGLPEPVIHRDLKPANILVRRILGDKPAYSFLIADFGIGHISAGRGLDSAKMPTRVANSLGTLRYAYTPLYASKNQKRGLDPDPRDDVYALGVIWYQLMLRDLSLEAPTGLGWDEELRALDLGDGHIRLLGQCLAGDEMNRPGDAQYLHDRLQALAQQVPVVEKPQPPIAPPQKKTAVNPQKPQAPVVEKPQPPIAPPQKKAAVNPQKPQVPVVEKPQPPVAPPQKKTAVNRQKPIKPDKETAGKKMRRFNDPRLPILIGAHHQEKPNDARKRKLAQEFPSPKTGSIITNNLGMKLAWVPPGTFLMGSPPGEAERGTDETQHKTSLTRGFFLGAHAVTQEQWQAVLGDNPSYFKGEKNLPVEQVSWEDCQQFLEKLSEREGQTCWLPTEAEWRYALPTEAEWEYACRAGTTTPFSFGGTISPEQVNYDGNYPYANGNQGLYRQKTTPVGSFAANPWGLFDMHGNVWEWCED